MEATMSASIRFDKLRFVKKLQQTDVNSPEFSEKLAEAFDEALEQSHSQLVTKADMREFESKIDVKLAQLKTDITSEMYKMAGFILAGVGALMTLMKFIN